MLTNNVGVAQPAALAMHFASVQLDDIRVSFFELPGGNFVIWTDPVENTTVDPHD